MIAAPALAMHNKNSLKTAKLCGCYYCLEIFDPKDITDWTDKSKKVPSGTTALCPHCHVDSILADSCGVELTKENLEVIHKAWF